MIRKVKIGLHTMRDIPAQDKQLAKTHSHWSNRLPKMVVVTRIGVKTDNAIVNVQQAKAVVFHEYQGKEHWDEIIMEEEKFRRVYKFVAKEVVTYVERREIAFIGNDPVKKARRSRRK